MKILITLNICSCDTETKVIKCNEKTQNFDRITFNYTKNNYTQSDSIQNIQSLNRLELIQT